RQAHDRRAAVGHVIHRADVLDRRYWRLLRPGVAQLVAPDGRAVLDLAGVPGLAVELQLVAPRVEEVERGPAHRAAPRGAVEGDLGLSQRRGDEVHVLATHQERIVRMVVGELDALVGYLEEVQARAVGHHDGKVWRADRAGG